MGISQVASGGRITVPDYVSQSLSPGTILAVRIVKGPKVMLTRSGPEEGTVKQEVITVRDGGTLVLPELVLQKLNLAPGDSVHISKTFGGKIFVEKERVKSPPAKEKAAQSNHTLPPYAARRQQRRTWYHSSSASEKVVFEATLEPVPKEDDPQHGWRGDTWAAKTKGAVGTGTTMSDALNDLEGHLRSDLHDLYFKMDMEPAPEPSIRPIFPPEIEDALERFRDHWFSTEARRREDVAIRPAVGELDNLGVPRHDITWILNLDSRLSDAYLEGGAG